MSKSEMSHVDVTMFVPLAFYLNAYLGVGIQEYYLLIASLVSAGIAYVVTVAKLENTRTNSTNSVSMEGIMSLSVRL